MNDIAKAVQEEKWIERHLHEYYSSKNNSSPVDRDFHLRVCFEVSNFLNSKKNFHLVQILTGWGLVYVSNPRLDGSYSVKEWFLDNVKKRPLGDVFGSEIAFLIWGVNWVEEFARLSAEPKAIAS